MSPKKSVCYPHIKLGWTLLIIVLLATSCTTLSNQQESMSDYYWEVQQLRLRAGKASGDVEALRELGVIYLRTGYYQEAHDVFTAAVELERADPKLWFYMGLSSEMLGNEQEALAVYSQAPTLSNVSIYSKAMKGRMEWLQGKTLQQPSAPLGQNGILASGSLNDDVLIVLPFECEGQGVEFTDLGKGISQLIGHNLDQLQGVDLVNYTLVNEARQQYRELDNRDDIDESAWIAGLLGAGKVVEGTCEIDTNNRISIDIFLEDIVENDLVAINAEDFLQNMPELERTIMDRLIEGLRVWIPNPERRTPLNGVNLETMLAFSDGLSSEDQGDYDQSIEYYNQALSLSPRFVLAEVRLDAVNNKILARGTSPDDLKNLLVYIESLVPTPGLLNTRLSQTGQAMSSGYIPGEDARKLPPGNVGELPAPPSPAGN